MKILYLGSPLNCDNDAFKAHFLTRSKVSIRENNIKQALDFRFFLLLDLIVTSRGHHTYKHICKIAIGNSSTDDMIRDKTFIPAV